MSKKASKTDYTNFNYFDEHRRFPLTILIVMKV